MATSIVKPKVSNTPTIKRGDLVIGKRYGSVILVTRNTDGVLSGVLVNGGNSGEAVGQHHTNLSSDNYNPFTGSVTLTQE